MNEMENLIMGSKILREQKLNIGIQFESNYTGTEYDLKKAIEEVENGFLEEKTKNELKGKLEAFLTQKEKLEQKIDRENLFVSKNLIYEYLEAYYEVVQFFMLKDDELLEDEDELAMLRHLLNFGYDVINREFSLYSPLVLNMVYKIKEIFEQYEEYAQKLGTNKLLETVYLKTILNYLQMLRHWTMQDKEGKLQVIPSIKICNSGLKMSFDVKRFSEIDSFYYLESRQVAEKVIHELEIFLKKEDIKQVKNGHIEFKVAILGNFETKYLNKEFLFYLKNNLLKEERLQDLIMDFKICILLEQYASGSVEEMEFEICSVPYITMKIQHCGEVNSVLKSAVRMKEIIQSYQVVILADCVSLYKITTEIVLNPDYFKQNFLFGKFKELSGYYTYNWNMLDNLYANVVTATNINTHEYGVDKKRIKRKILDYGISLVQENHLQKRFSTIYVLVSNRDAYDYYFDNKFAKCDILDNWNERCCQEYCGCARIGIQPLESMKLPIHNQYGPYIRFSIWQLVESFNLEKLEDQLDFILGTEIKVETLFSKLHERYLYLNYNKCWKKISLFYEEKDHFWVENLCLPLLRKLPEKLSENLFSKYFRYDLYSILYRNAQSIEDLLFNYLLCSYRLGDIEPQVKTMDLKQETQYSYSLKKFWVREIINNFDISASNSLSQNALRFDLDKKERITGGLKQISSEICEACERIGYENSYLYRNMKN